MSEVEQLRDEVRGLRHEVRELLRVMTPLAINRGSRQEQAKKAGVSRQTIWARERKVRAQIRADGMIPL